MRTQNYGVYTPIIDDSDELPLTHEEILQMEIEDHLAEEEAKVEEIRETYRGMI